MRSYKRIERCIARYLASRYRKVAEIGIGANIDVAVMLRSAGIDVIATDRYLPQGTDLPIPVAVDDIFNPCDSLYRGAEALYAIRPGPEMVPPLIALARRISADLLVYHLGGELHGDGGEVIDCGVILHRYHRAGDA
ncbi:MAG: UPF0146 family protein [Methanomicrobiales archaeon]